MMLGWATPPDTQIWLERSHCTHRDQLVQGPAAGQNQFVVSKVLPEILLIQVK